MFEEVIGNICRRPSENKEEESRNYKWKEESQESPRWRNRRPRPKKIVVLQKK